MEKRAAASDDDDENPSVNGNVEDDNSVFSVSEDEDGALLAVTLSKRRDVAVPSNSRFCSIIL